MTSQVFDCKSSSNRTTERVFWLRGVADFFDVDDAWMLRESEVTEASRQLAGKLRLGVLTRQDLEVLLAMTSVGAPSAPVTRLFEASTAEKTKQAFTGLDSRLGPLSDYLRYDNWIYSSERNLAQMVVHLQGLPRRLSTARIQCMSPCFSTAHGSTSLL